VEVNERTARATPSSRRFVERGDSELEEAQQANSPAVPQRMFNKIIPVKSSLFRENIWSKFQLISKRDSDRSCRRSSCTGQSRHACERPSNKGTSIQNMINRKTMCDEDTRRLWDAGSGARIFGPTTPEVFSWPFSVHSFLLLFPLVSLPSFPRCRLVFVPVSSLRCRSSSRL